MLRLGILGVESTHTSTFIKLIQQCENATLSAIAPEEHSLLNAFIEKNPTLNCVYCDAEELYSHCDAILITSRDGAKRLELARRVAKYKMPIWLDKPFTASVDDARELSRLLLNNETPFSAGTSIKYTRAVCDIKDFCTRHKERLNSVLITFKIQTESPYSGFHFYSHHAIEALLEAVGKKPIAATAKRMDDRILSIVEFEKFNATINFAISDMPYICEAQAEGEHITREITGADIRAAEKTLLDEFIDIATGKAMTRGTDFFTSAVSLSCAIEKSIALRERVLVCEI